ncbi:MAG: hypothetical protein ACE5GW_07350, partial [Planctomycetota bacterium]
MTDRNADRLAFRDGPHRWEGTLIVAVLLGLFAGIGMSAAAAPGAGDEDPAQATVVLNDGTEIAGTIVKETDDAVILRSAFGVTTIRRERIKEIRRGNSPLIEEFQERFEEAAARRRPAELLDLAEWAHRKGLEVEWRRTLDKVIEFDPDNTRARSELGHARLDGKWIEEREVEELLGQGYRLKGLELVKPEVGKTPSPKKADKPRKGSSAEKPKARKLSSAEKKKLEREREKRRKQQERYRRQRQLEYEGVAWRDRWQLKSSHYRIVCDSTEKVARTYMAIMEELHRVLSTRFKQRSLRSQKPTVTIYRNQQEFMNKTGMPKGVGGFYQPSSESVHAYHGTFGLTGTTFKVLAHEGTHQFQGKVLPNMRNFPKWIIEGMAVYYGDGSRLDHDKEKIVVGLVPRDRLFHIQEKMLQGTHTPLRSLVNLPGNKFGGSQYADSWSLLYYCFDG